ncbi:WXG100 family type VII secretion target [Sutcliffiella cohnii]|uniref:WXG100 family type VII secretion target n=1 Tax=Sutcliffiella cohnii TaxID=33932 RepID=UPI002E226468|nr:WXG100 family type VII secretion target [Sutcliffiella cohnii]
MARKMVVDPTNLDSVAKKLEKNANEYESVYHELLSEVNAMRGCWQGEDHIVYERQIKGLEKDIKRNVKYMREFAEHLKFCAKTYRDAQSEIITKAKGLIS